MTDYHIHDYSEKAIAVTTSEEFGRAHKDKFIENGGKYNPHLSVGKGWIFSKKRRDDVEKMLSSLKSSTPVVASAAISEVKTKPVFAGIPKNKASIKDTLSTLLDLLGDVKTTKTIAYNDTMQILIGPPTLELPEGATLYVQLNTGEKTLFLYEAAEDSAK
jgi:hypothetical protein